MPEPPSPEQVAGQRSSGHGRFTATERLPLTLHIVFWALIAASVAGIVFYCVRFLGFNASRYIAHAHEIEAQRNEAPRSDASVLDGLIGVLVVLGLLALFEMALAILIRRGRTWARIVTTVFLGLGVVLQIAQQPAGPAFLFGFFVSAVSLMTVWLLWLPSSNRFFRAMGLARTQFRSARVAAAMPAHPAAWVPDPSGRHQFRYWDGGRWTEYVGDNGAKAVDPL